MFDFKYLITTEGIYEQISDHVCLDISQNKVNTPPMIILPPNMICEIPQIIIQDLFKYNILQSNKIHNALYDIDDILLVFYRDNILRINIRFSSDHINVCRWPHRSGHMIEYENYTTDELYETLECLEKYGY